MGNYDIRVCNLKFCNAKLGEIEVGDRFRKDYGDVAALAQNITKDGLIQPIAVCLNDDPKKPYRLVAGGRRYQALTFIEEKLKKKGGSLEVSVRVYEQDLSEHELRVLEYAENMYRKDLTWQEKIKLEKRIHETQVAIHGEKISTTKGAKGWSQRDTAELMGKSIGKVSEDIQLARMMEDLPQIDWAKFKTKSDVQKAIKKVSKSVEQQTKAAKAERILKTGEDRKRVLTDAYKIEDFFVGVKKLDDHSINLCEIDPPYSIDLEKLKKNYDYTGYNEIHPDKYPEFMKNTFRECYRVLKNNSWMIVWFGPDPWFEQIHSWIVEAGFRCSRIPAIWVKGDTDTPGFVDAAQGQTMAPAYVLANCYEMFFYAKKGSPELTKQGAPNIFGYRPVPPAHKYHPTERPKELITDILQTFGQPNDRVLVPFAGSGRTMIEAAKLSMIPIGFDLTKEYRDGYIIRVHREI
jgi:DNA modification methylase